MTQPSDYATLIGSPRDAYAELVRLREENARLREALERISEQAGASWIADIARDALGEPS